jgi:hypothetical protein
MNGSPKAAFFDSIAEKWDGWEDLPILMDRLRAGLDEFGLGEEENVLDVGCGTGNLTRALLDRLSASGRIVAIDLAPRMIAVARRKVSDLRVAWHVLDVRGLPFPDASFDRVICYSVCSRMWPSVFCAGGSRRARRPTEPCGSWMRSGWRTWPSRQCTTSPMGRNSASHWLGRSSPGHTSCCSTSLRLVSTHRVGGASAGYSVASTRPCSWPPTISTLQLGSAGGPSCSRGDESSSTAGSRRTYCGAGNRTSRGEPSRQADRRFSLSFPWPAPSRWWVHLLMARSSALA